MKKEKAKQDLSRNRIMVEKHLKKKKKQLNSIIQKFTKNSSPAGKSKIAPSHKLIYHFDPTKFKGFNGI